MTKKSITVNQEFAHLEPKISRILKDGIHLRRVCDQYSKFYDGIPLFERIYVITRIIIQNAGLIERPHSVYGGDSADIPWLTRTVDHCVLRIAQLKQIFLQMPDPCLSTREKREKMRKEIEALANSSVVFRRIHFLLDEIEALVLAFENIDSPVIVRGLGIRVP